MKQLLLELGAAPAPSLENFVVGRNAAALAALRALAQQSGVIYFYGETGCGKTHLIKTMAALMPCLSADDVQNLDDAKQIALFDAFNQARAQGMSIVITGNAAPLELKLREDLRTRLGSGLTFQLHALSDMEKRDALRAHAQQRGLRLPDEVLNYVLTHLRRDMPTQMAVLDAIDNYSLSAKRPVTLPLVREALQSLQT
jgi:DnaA-homolog protein